MTHPGGRPTVMTSEVIGKLENAFGRGNTILESCLIAGISKDAYYDYLKLNPEFSERIELLRENVTMHARNNLVDSIMTGNIADSKWYLERKKKDEFSTSSDINLGGQPDNPVITNSTITPDEAYKNLLGKS